MQESCGGPDCLVRVVVGKGWKSVTVVSRTDCFLSFAHAVWDGARVAVFVDGSWCGQFTAAYDTAKRQSIPFQSMEGKLRSSIISEYSVTAEELNKYGGDVFAWANSPGNGAQRASAEFYERFRRNR